MKRRGHRPPRLVLALFTVALALDAGSAIANAPRAHVSAAPEPILGVRETVALVKGSATVRVKGAAVFVALAGAVSLPDESEVDATHGTVEVTVATAQPGQVTAARAYEGRFQLHQDVAAPSETHLTLTQPLAGCGRAGRRRGRRAAMARGGSHSRARKARQVWVSEHGGSWGTGAHDVTAAGEGTRWLTRDECGRSEVRVAEGRVLVHDLILNTTVTVSAGQAYVAAEEGRALMPPLGQVLTGQSGGSSTLFAQEVGKHPAVYGYFATWGQSVQAPLSYARGSDARLLLHLSTDSGYGAGAGEVISPAGIANGGSDEYLIALGRELAASGQPVYIALLPEMNQANNAYSAFSPTGGSRGPSNSTASYRQAFRRTVLIVRGGSVAAIDRRLRALRLPALHTSRTRLAAPRVAFMWAPQTAGSPDIPANSPAAYYPGSAYVDIVGTDFYSAFPNFAGLASLYGAYSSKPFGFNEWAMWRSGDPGFVRELFAFVRSHRRIGLMVYNQGLQSGGPFRLSLFPAAAQEIRRQQASASFLAYPPDIVRPASG